MAVHPLRPATHRSLGEPLPHQLTNGTRDHLSPLYALTFLQCWKRVSYGINPSFPRLSRCERQVSHALLTRPPLRQLNLHPERIHFKSFARLACVRHAASVRPEPGSNSHLKVDLFCSLFADFILFLNLFHNSKYLTLFNYQMFNVALSRQLIQYNIYRMFLSTVYLICFLLLLFRLCVTVDFIIIHDSP